MAVSAYAFERWPRVGRAEAIELRQTLRALPVLSGGSRAAVLREAESLFEAPCGANAQAAELVPTAELGARLAEPWLAVLLEAAGDCAPLLLEVPSELARHAVDRVLGGDVSVERLRQPSFDAMSQGALAYIAARLLGPTPWRVLDVIDAPRSLQALLGTRALVLPIELRVGSELVGRMRVLAKPASRPVPESLAGAESGPEFEHLEVVLCAHAARCALSPAQLRTLSIGDVILPEHCGLRRSPNGYVGELRVHVLGRLQTGFHARAGGREIVLGAVLTNAGDATVTEGKRIPTESSEPQTEAVTIDDVPIELCLELARFSLTLRELGALRTGEVLATGRLIGERATLSASGKPVARGELVDVDGEVGLRVLELLSR